MSQQGLDFSKKISKMKMIFDLTFTDVQKGCQKVPKSDFQNHSNLSDFFFTEEYQFRRRVFYCHFLKTSNFEPLCFLKWCPILDGLSEHL